MSSKFRWKLAEIRFDPALHADSDEVTMKWNPETEELEVPENVKTRLLMLPAEFGGWWPTAAMASRLTHRGALEVKHMMCLCAELFALIGLKSMSKLDAYDAGALIRAIWRPEEVVAEARTRGIDMTIDEARLTSEETGVALTLLAEFLSGVDPRDTARIRLLDARDALRNVRATLLALAAFGYDDPVALRELLPLAIFAADAAAEDNNADLMRMSRALVIECGQRISTASTEAWAASRELHKKLSGAFAAPDSHPRFDKAKHAEAAVQPDRPSLVVLSGVKVESGDRDHKKTLEQYAVLAQPVPLAGGEADLDVLHDTLTSEFPWLEEHVDDLVSDLAFRRRMGQPWFRLPPTLLVGPPGAGKTRFCHRLAEICGTAADTISVSGTGDNRMLAGTARGWASAQPCFPILSMHRHKVANPLIVVDELDKAGVHVVGTVHQTLLNMTERQSSRRYFDECLLQNTNLGEVSWIATANNLEPLPDPLLSRFRVVRVQNPGPEHFDAIVTSIHSDFAKEMNVRPDDLPELSEEAIDALREAFAEGFSIRKIKAAYTRALTVAPQVGQGMRWH